MRYLERVDATFPSARPARSLHRFANPGRFLRLAGRAQPWLDAAALALLAVGLTWGLLLAPADWQQGDAVRIIYVHVPSAWLASAGYLGLAVCSALSLVWRHPLADLAAAGRPVLRLRYRTDVLDAACAARIGGYHRAALDALTADPDADPRRRQHLLDETD